jgi:aryl-alcohol dehydrogenase-like predicted oxidoreductase
MNTVAFGLGLIGIGKPWGFRNPTVPDERQARALLERAFELGVRYFDTAPSYGASEERLGRFLQSLAPVERQSMTIATKFGEHWDSSRAEPFVDHSLAALRRSLDGSVSRLGKVDVLQLHKTTPEVLKSDDLARAWEYAASAGIGRLGASVSDLESAGMVLRDRGYSLIQLPFNAGHRIFGGVVDDAGARGLMDDTAARGLMVAVNRPFGMGEMLYGERALTKAQAFGFILERKFQGVILSGTKSPDHLEENWEAFQEAARRLTSAEPAP